MAPESERAMCTGCGHPPHVGGECKTFVDIPLGMPYCECIADTEPTLTCSEVVERLADCAGVAFDSIAGSNMPIPKPYFNRAKASKILHSWRERRVQELEEALRGLVVGSRLFDAYDECLFCCASEDYEEHRESCAYRVAMAVLAKGQIRKGAKHE